MTAGSPGFGPARGRGPVRAELLHAELQHRRDQDRPLTCIYLVAEAGFETATWVMSPALSGAFNSVRQRHPTKRGVPDRGHAILQGLAANPANQGASMTRA